ncbi:nickel transporter [Ramlibacter tataouinensis]|uniref:Nickel/cobalt efflux system n=1 Tax=Ramlibacter tataouinensis TaxID=94132 RepID=A0A127K1V0_9BURK|nr:nickel transporter [Ramlibacter tataouinensis]
MLTFYGFVVALHAIGWGIYLHYSASHPALLGLGLAAYMFGLRHAFDADHIAAIDDTVRLLVQKGGNPMGVGFFFSLGHSFIVFGMVAIIAGMTHATKAEIPLLREMGGVIGMTVSGVFLWVVGLLNLGVLLQMLKVFRRDDDKQHRHAHIEELLKRRGLISRILSGRLQRIIGHSWQMLPLGMLFGLGFDTASEVALLAMSAGASTGDLPLAAVLALPVLFAAGMSAMDTTDGVLMVRAYNWAFVNPLRKIFYNLTVTGISVAVALVIGSVQLLQVLVAWLRLAGPFFDTVAAIDMGGLGYLIVSVFMLAWLVSWIVWRFTGVEQWHGGHGHAHSHEHKHDSGVRHSHRHFH